jgi:hypothetical protein
MICARKELTVLELVELLSLGGQELLRSLLQDFDNTIVRRELEDLAILAGKHPREFLTLVESCKNRFVRWLGDKRLARMLGQKRGLDPLAVMADRSIVLADLSALSYDDASFVGCLLNTMYFTAARQRAPMRSAPHRLVLDEAESLLVVSSARMCDQTAKYGLFLYAAVQRLGQLRARGDFLLDALLANCGLKITFGLDEHESARFLGELFYTGHIDLEAWVPSSSRPVAVGNEKRIVRSTSVAEHEATHEMASHTTSDAYGEATGTMSATSSATGEFSGTGESGGLVMSPPVQMLGPSAPNASLWQYPTSQSSGRNSSSGRSSMEATSSSENHSAFAMHGEAYTEARGKSRGTSVTHGESEVFTTVYEWMPSQRFSLEEQLHRLAGEIMTLPRRELILKADGDRPIRTRTADVLPEFRAPHFERLMVPAFRAAIVKRSPVLVPVADVDAEIAARLDALRTPPAPPIPAEPVTAPQPISDPTLDPVGFAADVFWPKRKPAPDQAKPTKKRHPARTPRKRPSLSVIEGGGGDNENPER